MTKKRRRFNPDFKFRVALGPRGFPAKGQRTLSELSNDYGVHPNQISQWKQQVLKHGATVFSQNGAKEDRDQEAMQTELYEQIGRLKMELEWLKKSLLRSPETKRSMVEPSHPLLSVRRQCELLGLNRSTLYYQPAGESAENLHLMRPIDEQYLRGAPWSPFYGWPRMTAHLRRQGYAVNHKRVQRLMQKMGLQAIYPKPRTSRADKGHKKYPYLLRGLEIVGPTLSGVLILRTYRCALASCISLLYWTGLRQQGRIMVQQTGTAWRKLNQFGLAPGETQVVGWVRLTRKHNVGRF